MRGAGKREEEEEEEEKEEEEEIPMEAEETGEMWWRTQDHSPMQQ